MLNTCQRLWIPENGGVHKWGYPPIIHFNGIFHYKPSIFGYPHFRKHPKTKRCLSHDPKVKKNRNRIRGAPRATGKLPAMPKMMGASADPARPTSSTGLRPSLSASMPHMAEKITSRKSHGKMSTKKRNDYWWLWMIIDDHWWLLMIIDDYWWLLMIIDDYWWLLMIVDDYSWLFMTIDDYWWLLMIIGDYFMIIDDYWWLFYDYWWLLMIIGDYFMIIDDYWWLLMIIDDYWWLFMTIHDHWWLLDGHSHGIRWKKYPLTKDIEGRFGAWTAHLAEGVGAHQHRNPQRHIRTPTLGL